MGCPHAPSSGGTILPKGTALGQVMKQEQGLTPFTGRVTPHVIRDLPSLRSVQRLLLPLKPLRLHQRAPHQTPCSHSPALSEQLYNSQQHAEFKKIPKKKIFH